MKSSRNGEVLLPKLAGGHVSGYHSLVLLHVIRSHVIVKIKDFQRGHTMWEVRDEAQSPHWGK